MQNETKLLLTVESYPASVEEWEIRTVCVILKPDNVMRVTIGLTKSASCAPQYDSRARQDKSWHYNLSCKT